MVYPSCQPSSAAPPRTRSLNRRRVARSSGWQNCRSIPLGWTNTFEMYADQAAYDAHLNTSHFVKYKTGTQEMVKSLVLVETDPILLRAKPR